MGREIAGSNVSKKWGGKGSNVMEREIAGSNVSKKWEGK